MANPSGASGVAQGTQGTIIAGSTGTLPTLIQWDGWAAGHDGNCPAASCGTCTPSGLGRWWTACDQFAPVTRPQMAACTSCSNQFREGAFVTAAVANPSGAPGLAAGTKGKVIAGSNGTLPLLVEWQGWTGGHDGNCGVSNCGTCVAGGTSRWYVTCANVTLLIP
ncbi:MAG: hypothetical protein ACYC8T_34470 [Myxococcaceae bacterium]